MGSPTSTIPRWNVVHHLQKRGLLIAINSIAALSIFFFGYDQGMMGGVNNAKDYIDTMGFGYTATINGSPNTPVITNTLLQGGIVSVYYLGTLLGALLGGWVGEKIGRIRTIALGALWGVLGASLQTSAQNHNWMICGTRASNLCQSQADPYSTPGQRRWHWHSQRHRACVRHRDCRAHLARPVHRH